MDDTNGVAERRVSVADFRVAVGSRPNSRVIHLTPEESGLFEFGVYAIGLESEMHLPLVGGPKIVNCTQNQRLKVTVELEWDHQGPIQCYLTRVQP